MSVIWPIPKIELIPFAEIVERRRVGLVTSQPAWDAVKEHLNLTIVWQTDIQEATLAAWQQALRTVSGEPEVIYAVGGGLAVDAAKYMAQQLALDLICLPTALSVDAFITWASGIRQDGCITYIETP
ncbi:MAG: iron-containing alcohol dehydrogenase [Chloroflexota bacterium]